jgi:tetratricopeptide (TPR) repeat protein
MMVLADPTGDLKGAYAEGLQIRDFMDRKPSLVNVTLRSSNATAESIKSKLRNFDLIHFAGHSDYDISSPKKSGWRLNGGILRTDDINKMAGSAKMPAMIFANACQSARAEQWTLHPSFESKIFGLANAFLISGVKHYIGTFWEVPDEPSRRFAIEFYKHLLSNHSVGAALRKSRQSLVDLYGEETIVWASYVLYGDPTFNYMDHTQDTPTIEKTVPQKRIRPSAQDRTREEVIDFTKSRARFSINKWWLLSLMIIVSGVLLFVGWPMYENHKIYKIEQQALSSYFSGNIDSARELCQQLQQYDINNPISCLILGNIQLGKGDTEGAQKYYQTTINSHNSSSKVKSEAMMGLARLASMEHRPQKAIQLYQDAAQIDPNNVRALSSQAMILGRQNREAEALSLYRKALDISPKSIEIQLAAQDISERLSLQADQAKQSRIDKLVNELIERNQRTIPTVRNENLWTSKPLSVWLMGFEEMGFSLQEGQAQIVHVLIRNLLTKNTRITVVERAVLDKLLSELKLGASPLADRQTALSIGRLMATRILLPGQIQYENGRALVSIRAIESETGLIKASIIGTYDSSQTSAEVADDLALKITNELIANFPLRCKVVNINENELILDIGQNLGLKSKLQFEGVDEDVIVQVTSVKPDQSIAKVLKGENFIKPGLRLEEKRNDSY